MRHIKCDATRLVLYYCYQIYCQLLLCSLLLHSLSKGHGLVRHGLQSRLWYLHLAARHISPWYGLFFETGVCIPNLIHFHWAVFTMPHLLGSRIVPWFSSVLITLTRLVSYGLYHSPSMPHIFPPSSEQILHSTNFMASHHTQKKKGFLSRII